MSGFCGFTVTDPNNAETIVIAMLEAIAHRGSGNIRTYLGDKIALGFRQFNTTDCENNNENLQIMLDGNIYNNINLCDSYKENGKEVLKQLRGAFAFAIYDIEKDQLFCARDNFGSKPFYYAQTENGILFGSEIKSIIAHPDFVPVVNLEALGQYLTFQYSVLNETFFKGVYKLPPGHSLTYENGIVEITKYHSNAFVAESMSLYEATEKIDNAVCESVALHTNTETEIGAFLSGGVDSSYVTAIFSAKIVDIPLSHPNKKAFTVGFDYEKYNEIEYAKSLSDKLGIEHITKIISTEEYWESLPKVQYHMDEPLADPAAVAFYFACREAAQHVKIALSGEAADEFFGGYNIYKEPLSLRFYTSLPLFLRKWLASWAKWLPTKTKGRSFLMRGAKTVEERFIGNAHIFSQEERNKLLKHQTLYTPMDITRPYYEQVKHEDDITKMQYLDINLWLTDDILLQADKISMAHGLQVRTPLLDREVFKVAASLPVKHRVSKKETKVAFRKAAAKHLPPETANRRKLGFPVPIRIWLRDEKYYGIVKTHFDGNVAEKYFHKSELLNLLDDHFYGKQDNSRKIWTVYMFLLWHDEFFMREEFNQSENSNN